jgi:hypothetical protein
MATVAATGLRKLRQDDFSAGAFQGTARHLIPSTGLYGAQNALFDEDAACYKRGGSEYLVAPAVGSSLRMIWDGVLAAGPRTLVANTADYAVLNVGDTAFINIGGPGMAEPARATVFDGLLIFDDGTVYGGSLRTSGSAGTPATATQGSAVVVGTGSNWATTVDPGMLLQMGNPAAGRYYPVQSVDSNTQVTLTVPYQGATVTDQYNFTAIGSANALITGYSGFASIFNRLLAFAGRKVKFTGGRQANGDVLHSFGADDEHEFSGTVLGAVPIRDLVFVFTTDGVFAIQGMAFDLLDPEGVNFQQTVEPVNADLILWGKPGIASYQNEMLIPGVDGLWSMGSASAPVLLSKSIQARWRNHVHAGNKPGLAAVYRNHYHLPVLNAANEVVDHLVCRLDRPQDSPIGRIFPWSWWTGSGANTPALTTRISGTSSRSPKLLAADRATGRVLDLTSTFDPSDMNASEADGSNITWEVELRDYATGDGNLNHARRLRIRYELATPSSATATPTITALLSTGATLPGVATWDDVTWDDFVWADVNEGEYEPLDGTAPPDQGRNPHTWHFKKRARYVRAILSSSQPAQRLILRSVEWYVRPAGNDR